MLYVSVKKQNMKSNEESFILQRSKVGNMFLPKCLAQYKYTYKYNDKICNNIIINIMIKYIII